MRIMKTLITDRTQADASYAEKLYKKLWIDFTEQEKADFEAVKNAISQTRRLRNGEMRMEMIDLVFWKQSHTLSGAAMQFPLCEREVRQWHTDFIRLVGRNRGLID